MIKVAIIQDTSYFTWKSRVRIYKYVFASVLFALLVLQFFDLTIPKIMTAGLVAVAVLSDFYFTAKLSKMAGQNKLEIESHEVRLVDKKGEIIETISVSDPEQLRLQGSLEYGDNKSTLDVISDKLHKNYHLLIDSHYASKQLKELESSLRAAYKLAT